MGTHGKEIADIVVIEGVITILVGFNVCNEL